ncbi:uncharacterized protein LOC110932214 [Helianthus annuus]|uniref:uncharacterized protein LOC110932214 n=1 Tax=Helianthus annuus TaxID=4232 RepID=UPI001653065F|nr:uncharacterized protein LOC110932214 [Helianthus annuus]
MNLRRQKNGDGVRYAIEAWPMFMKENGLRFGDTLHFTFVSSGNLLILSHVDGVNAAYIKILHSNPASTAPPHRHQDPPLSACIHRRPSTTHSTPAVQKSQVIINMSESQKKVGKKKDKKSCPESDSIKVDLENDSSMNIDVEDDEVYSVEVDDTNDSDDNKSGVKRQRKERSIVWQYFTKLKKKAVGGKVPSKCNKCNHVIIYDSKQAIAVVLDPRYKLHFIEWSYSQVYGRDSNEYEYVDEVLHSTFHEYVELNMDGGSSTNSNVASTSDASKGVEETGDDDSTSVFGVSARLKDFDQIAIVFG